MIFKGNFLYTPALGELTVREGEYLVVEGEKCAGFYRALPQEYAGQPVTDFGRALVLPAFCDLHLHAPQMVNRGVGYDQELLPWLETYTFPVEARYGDTDFAEAAWKRFLNRMWANGTLRFSAFATIHKEAAWRLMELTERAGLSALIGKVNMDRNAPDSLREDTDASLADTEELICRSRAELKHVEYILTPRFVPSTTARLMDGLGRLGERYELPVQSHLSENRSEIAWVGQLHPECASYTEVYRDYGLLRRGCTIMAHAVHLTGREEAILREEGVTLAHCAQSNTNLSSGVMPLRRSLSEGLRCCVASDVAGGHAILREEGVTLAHCAQSNTNLSSGVMPLRRSLSEGLRCCVASDVAGGHAAAMNRHVAATVGLSKLRALDHPEERLLSLPEALYLATKGPGEFFGKVGSFEPGYDFDALVVDVDELDGRLPRTPFEKLEQFLYDGDDRDILARYSRGSLVEKPFTE